MKHHPAKHRNQARPTYRSNYAPLYSIFYTTARVHSNSTDKVYKIYNDFKWHHIISKNRTEIYLNPNNVLIPPMRKWQRLYFNQMMLVAYHVFIYQFAYPT